MFRPQASDPLAFRIITNLIQSAYFRLRWARPKCHVPQLAETMLQRKGGWIASFYTHLLQYHKPSVLNNTYDTPDSVITDLSNHKSTPTRGCMSSQMGIKPKTKNEIGRQGRRSSLDTHLYGPQKSQIEHITARDLYPTPLGSS